MEPETHRNMIEPQQASLPGLRFPDRSERLSPTKQFARRIQARFSVDVSAVYHDFALPDGMSPMQLERLLLEDKYRTNAGITIVNRPVLGLLDGVSRVVRFGCPASHGESVAPRTEELRALTKKLITLNPQELGSVDAGSLQYVQLYNVLWGAACSINTPDLLNFCVRHAPCSTTVAGQAAIQAHADAIYRRCGEKILWTATRATLEMISAALDNSPTPVRQSPLSFARWAALQALEKL
jgi:hypothetical protein